MKLGEKIVAAEQRITDYRDQIADIVAKSTEEDRDLLDEETDVIEGLEGDLEAAEKSLRGLKAAEKSLSGRAESRTQVETKGVNTIIPARVKKDEGAFPLLTKLAVIKALAHVQKASPAAIIQERYAHDARIIPAMEYMERAATGGATTTASGWAAELVEDDLAGFINELAPVSVYGALAAGGIAIPFGTANSVTVPRRSGSGNVSGSFVGEGASIPVKQDEYASQTYNRYKAAVITVFSEELARTSTPQVEGLLRSAILSDTGDMLDTVVTNPAATAISGIRPASPWNGADTQASAGDTLENILTDLRFLLNTLSAANAGRAPRIVMNPARLTGLSMLTNANGSFVFREEIGQGRIMGVPLIVSTNCPADHVFIIDLADFGTAFGVPEYMVSDQVSLAMADDDGVAPTMADTNAVNDAGGSIHISDAAGTTPPTVVRSMFQTWQVALRMVLPISWGMMRPGTAAYLTGVSW